MNPRIQELAVQVYGSAATAQEIKFAELIIRRCAMKANATALDLRNYPELNGRKYVGDCILKCFGVEE
jgi:hypothetical protein